jgi:NAD(P)-dependent dehydrogenase (short-subunit alcohol dehydrogenase family)
VSQELNGKVAIVTGAGQGIGEAMATALHGAGASVAVVDISGKQVAVAERLGERAIAVQADVSQAESVEQAIAQVVGEFGRLDVMCNNAGLEGDAGPITECSEEQYDRIMSVNARGVFLGMRFGIPAILESGGGAIINTASTAALVAFPGYAAYCASKGAVLMMTKAAAAEYAGRGVRINAICPGVTKTALVEGMPPEIVADVKGATPMGRFGAPSEIGQAALFLASDAASFVTGTALSVDGGYTTV